MKYIAEVLFDVDPQTVGESYKNAEINDYIAKNHPSVTKLELLKYEEAPQGKVTVEVRYTVNVDMPSALKKIAGDANTMVMRTIMDREKNTAEFEIIPPMMAEKIKCKGKAWFTQKGGQWVQHLDADIEAKIFGIGGMVEKFIVKQAEESFVHEAKLRNEMLKKQKA